MPKILPTAVGTLIRDTRKQRNMTQAQLAELLNTSQSAIGRIECGGQNLSLEMINRIAEALETPLIQSAHSGGTPGFRVKGPTKLSGSIDVRSSKNAAVALLCASLLNAGKTILHDVAQIEEVNRILEVLTSLGMEVSWSADKSELTLQRPAELALDDIDVDAARCTRSVIMFLGPLLHLAKAFKLPYAGGCELGIRTVGPHLHALREFGLHVTPTDGFYHSHLETVDKSQIKITLIERGDTVTENVLMAAALHQGETIIRNASSNYMVQDLCFFLEELGVKISGIGTTTLRVQGVDHIDAEIHFAPSEDPIEAMSLIAAAIVTESQLTIRRSPIEFLEVELAVLEEMGLNYELSEEYPALNQRTRLVDLTVFPSKLTHATDKIHPLPFPGLNIDNLPFFALIAATADGQTLVHDWVYENRAIHLLDLRKFGADIQLLDPHRISVTGPTAWRFQEIICPSALRPAVCMLLAALAAKGESVLRDVYVINRGYEDLPTRLNELGAQIETFSE
ncbi:MAG: UDP-N-acetylglucosamine 1-carboxyvinyltransferase [Propionibacteriaceae bacterium]|nr:UDP-N-acetylglucosamine 1-carboxyvinyltransferase [Propionibacteriaceae bacterium]